MNALLIDPVTREISSTQITHTADLVTLIGSDTLEFDAVGENGDRIYFDENCFIRGTEGRFQIDSLIPLAGKGVLVGTDSNDIFKDVATDIEDLKRRIKYL